MVKSSFCYDRFKGGVLSRHWSLPVAAVSSFWIISLDFLKNKDLLKEFELLKFQTLRRLGNAARE
jgi:hypothetical protein